MPERRCGGVRRRYRFGYGLGNRLRAIPGRTDAIWKGEIMSSIIDTSKMSEGQRAALEMAEASRDTRELSGFAASLFDGVPDFGKLFPFARQDAAERGEGYSFIDRLSKFLMEQTDPDAIDREGEIPDDVL